MSSSKIKLKQRILIFLIDLFGAAIIRLLGATCRYKVIGEAHLSGAETNGMGVIIALWHGRMLLPVYHLRNRGICALISLHNDGEMISRVVRKLGYVTRRGSPKEGGMEGFKEMLADLKAGRSVAIMPDGPTGPRHSVRDGVIHLARLSGAAIVPISYSANPRWVARSWDKFNVMKPFSRGFVVIGTPFTLERKMAGEEGIQSARTLVQNALVSVEVEADELAGFASEEK